ncbi:hypothetical protein H0H93_006321, partial [Arthromyces matolae]
KDGMRSLPTAEYPDKTEGVTLKCTRKQETVCIFARPSISRLTYLHRHAIVTKSAPLVLTTCLVQ